MSSRSSFCATLAAPLGARGRVLLALTLLLAALAGVSAAAVELPGPLACDLEEESWTACLADTDCATQWFLASGDAAEREVFEYLLARYAVLDLEFTTTAVLDEYCVGGTQEPSWLPLLRQARHCPANEEPDPTAPSGGCRCQFNRICHEDSPRTAVYDFVSLYVILGAILIVALYVARRSTLVAPAYVAAPIAEPAPKPAATQRRAPQPIGLDLLPALRSRR